MSKMDKGSIKIGLSIGLTALITCGIAFGLAYSDIQKGVSAYERVESLDVIEFKLDTLIRKVESLECKIDNMKK